MPELMQLVNEARLEIEEIYPADLKRMQQSGEDFVLLDVREPDEVPQSHSYMSLLFLNPNT